jgi:hypothetical protein
VTNKQDLDKKQAHEAAVAQEQQEQRGQQAAGAMAGQQQAGEGGACDGGPGASSDGGKAQFPAESGDEIARVLARRSGRLLLMDVYGHGVTHTLAERNAPPQ